MTQNYQTKKITGLKTIVEQLIRLEKHKTNITVDIKNVYRQAENQGLDTKSLKQFIKLHDKKADDSLYIGLIKSYQQAYEAELRGLFESDPERFKLDYFDQWIQWINK